MLYVKILLDSVFLILIGYFSFHYFLVLKELRRPVLFPVTEEQCTSIRIHPERPIKRPTIAAQKSGIFIYGGMLLFVLFLYILSLFFQGISYPFYFLLLIPFTNAQGLLNAFAINKKGIISNLRFIPWRRIKSYECTPIDLNHRYYGFSDAANNGWEISIKGKCLPIRFIVTSEAVKEEVEQLLEQHLHHTTSIR